MLLDDVCDYLSTGGVTGTIQAGFMPEAPDAMVAVYETPGYAAVHAMSAVAGAALAERPSVQVVVRASQYDYAAARTVANQIWKLLDQMPERTINGTRYLWGTAKQSPFLLMRDETKRPLIACNFDLLKELST